VHQLPRDLQLADWTAVRQHAGTLTRDVFHETHYLVGVAILVVIPDVNHQVFSAIGNRRQAIKTFGVGTRMALPVSLPTAHKWQAWFIAT